MEKQERGTRGGCYLYGIAPQHSQVRFVSRGIAGSPVYTVDHRGICAIVHDCPSPYHTTDPALLTGWARLHQNVLDEAKAFFGTVVPVGFDSVIQFEGGSSSNEAVEKWLIGDYERLSALVARMSNKDEYAVQVSYAPKVIGDRICREDSNIRRVLAEMPAMSDGAAYLSRQRLEHTVKHALETLADDWFRDFYSRIRPHCCDVVIEKPRGAESGRVMLLNLSCLVARDGVENLGAELELINALEGVSVHFSGPWPPYSFVRTAGKEVKSAAD